MLLPPLLVAVHSAAAVGDGGEETEHNRIMAVMSDHLTTLAASGAGRETSPCLDEIKSDLERLVMLREEIIQAFAASADADGIDPDVGLALSEYAALLGALLSANIGMDPMDNLDLQWHVVDPLGASPGKNGRQRRRDAQDRMDIDTDDDGGDGRGEDIDASQYRNGGKGGTRRDTKNAFGPVVISASSFREERKLAVYLLAAVEYHLAAAVPTLESHIINSTGAAVAEGDDGQLKDAEIGFGTAAALFDHLRVVMEAEDNDDNDAAAGESMVLRPSTMELFQLTSLTSGQEAVYCRALDQQRRKKPMHAMLAKLAAGCADWRGKVVSHVEVEESVMHEDEGTSHGIVPANSSQIKSTYQAGEYYYRSVAEYHEALAPRIRNNTGAQVGRLRSALDLLWAAESELLGTDHRQLTASVLNKTSTKEGAAELLAAHGEDATAVMLLSGLLAKICRLHAELQPMLRTIEDGNTEDIPSDVDLPATRGQNMIKSLRLPPEVDLNNVGLAADCLDPPPLEHLLDDDAVRICMDFHARLREMYESAKVAARNSTNTAKEELGRLGVEEGLKTYKASVEARDASSRCGGSSCGIPPVMAAQIRSLHSSQGVILLRQNLYVLQDVAEVSRRNLDKVENMLNETARLDATFRRTKPMFRGREVDVEHGQIALPSFEGPDAVMVGARDIVARCRTLLDSANQGDEKLRVILDQFETDPKYKLVMLPIERLERLLADSGVSDSDNKSVQEDVELSKDEHEASTVDTAALEQCLFSLDNLLAARDSNISEMQTKIEAYHLRPEIVQAVAVDESNGAFNESLDQLYIAVAQRSLRLFRFDMIGRLKESIKEQEQLLQSILQLHAEFRADRAAQKQEPASTDAAPRSPKTAMHEAYLQKIASALETIAWIQPQLIKGSTFYEQFLLRINELNEKVSDVNAVLANERICFEESNDSFRKEEMRRKQEEEDEILARELAGTLTLDGKPRAEAEHEEQMQRDQEMAVELERQLREEEVNASTSNLASGPTPEERGDEHDDEAQMIPEDEAPPLHVGRSSYDVDGVANVPGESNEQDMTTARAAGRTMPRRRSNSVHETGRNEPTPPTNERRRRRSYDSSFGDVPQEIFARGGRDDVSILSMDVSSLGSESILRTYQRQQQMNERHNQVPPSLARRRGTPLSDTADQEPPAYGSIPAAPADNRSPIPGRSVRPGMVQLRNDEVPEIDVNDRAFAQLVSMDFDPDAVRDALQRFDNSVERAMEYILTHQ